MREFFFFVGIIGVLCLLQSCMKMNISDSKAKKEFSTAGVILTTAIWNENNFPLHYTTVGADSLPTLFFVHGSPGSWSAFTRYMKDSALLAKYRMVSVDRPGFGGSNFGDARNLEEQSAIIGPLVRWLSNNRPIYAIGHSLGGPLIVRMQLDHPNLFSGLVLLSASVDPDEEKPEKWRNVFNKIPLTYFLPGVFRPSNSELWYLKKDLKTMDSMWAAITCPVWIIHGDKDSFVPPGNAAYAERKLTNAVKHVQMLPDARHFTPWEQYNEVKQVLLELPQ